MKNNSTLVLLHYINMRLWRTSKLSVRVFAIRHTRIASRNAEFGTHSQRCDELVSKSVHQYESEKHGNTCRCTIRNGDECDAGLGQGFYRWIQKCNEKLMTGISTLCCLG
jgi:hypothetical protein